MATRICPDCKGEGEIPENPTRDPDTGLWDANWTRCLPCDGWGAQKRVRNGWVSARPDPAPPVRRAS